MADELRKKAMKGSAWMVGMKLAVNLLGVCSTVVLARLLTPNDFGLVALAGSAYAYFALFGQFGFDIRLIQLQNAERAHYDTAWTANILVGLSIAVAMGIVAKPAAWFFQEPRIEAIVYSFSLLSLAKGFENIGVVNFRKRLAFRGEFLYFVLPKFASVTMGITAAVILRNYWALVIGMLSAQITSVLYSHFSQSFRPRFTLSKFSDLFQFTKWILGIKILRYLNFNGIEILLGRFRGPDAVGLYGVASMVGYLPSSELAAPTKRALFPSFSTISHDVARLRSAFVKVFGATMLVTIPAAFGIMAIAHSFIFVVFGEKWLGAAPLLEVMAIVGLLEVTNNLGEPVLMARAALRPFLIVLATHTTILLTSALFLVNSLGAIGAAYAMISSAVLAMPMYIYVAKTEIGFRIRDLLQYVWRPLIASIAMAVSVRNLEAYLTADGPPSIPILIALVATGVIVYVSIVLILWALSGRAKFPEVMILDAIRGPFTVKRPT